MIARFLFLFNAQNVCALRIAKTNAALKICSSQVVDKISDFGSVENVDTRPSYPLSCSDFEGKIRARGRKKYFARGAGNCED